MLPSNAAVSAAGVQAQTGGTSAGPRCVVAGGVKDAECAGHKAVGGSGTGADGSE